MINFLIIFIGMQGLYLADPTLKMMLNTNIVWIVFISLFLSALLEELLKGICFYTGNIQSRLIKSVQVGASFALIETALKYLNHFDYFTIIHFIILYVWMSLFHIIFTYFFTKYLDNNPLGSVIPVLAHTGHNLIIFYEPNIIFIFFPFYLYLFYLLYLKNK